MTHASESRATELSTADMTRASEARDGLSTADMTRASEARDGLSTADMTHASESAREDRIF